MFELCILCFSILVIVYSMVLLVRWFQVLLIGLKWFRLMYISDVVCLVCLIWVIVCCRCILKSWWLFSLVSGLILVRWWVLCCCVCCWVLLCSIYIVLCIWFLLLCSQVCVRFIGIVVMFRCSSRLVCRFIVLFFGFSSIDIFSIELGVYLVVSVSMFCILCLVSDSVLLLVRVCIVVVLVQLMWLLRLMLSIRLVIVFRVMWLCCLFLNSCCLLLCWVVMFWICDMKCSGWLCLLCISDIDSCVQMMWLLWLRQCFLRW